MTLVPRFRGLDPRLRGDDKGCGGVRGDASWSR